MSKKFYWAVMPHSSGPPTWTLKDCRIEQATNALNAITLAFGSGMFHPDLSRLAEYDIGKWFVKNMGSRVRVIQSDAKRIALLKDPSGWHDPFPFGYRQKVGEPKTNKPPKIFSMSVPDQHFLRLVVKVMQLPRNRFGKIESYHGGHYAELTAEATRRGFLKALPHGGEDCIDQAAMFIQLLIGDKPVSIRN